MKKLFIIGVFIFLFITNIIFIRTTVSYKNKLDNQVFKVYSFEGESNGIKISDGLILISTNKHSLIGGKIQYKTNKEENIKSYFKTIYIDKQGNKEIVLLNSSSHSGDNSKTISPDGFLLNEGIGEISSKKLFSEEEINIIKDNLYFSLDCSTDDGKRHNYIVKLKVKEFNMN
ncbi:hypothetical protein [Tepidibacter aestuarii]|uniref:hypothetical protein n=1 Tax=Tepidibacter aestuarii TaxID=2925782 RepID=UPI0020C021BD|nr:hypothetical protein [Tepidibacter aestuarii]CAH2214881.1 conserved protein of unknown function [Tepidibacter aestuarii]